MGAQLPPALSQLRSNPAGARAALGVTQGYVPVCRQRPCADNLANLSAAGGRNTFNSRQACYTPAGAGVTDIVLAFPGFLQGQPEADFPLTYTVTASIEYPVGTFTQVRFAGGTSLTVTPGRVVYRSDPVPLWIPANTLFYVKLFASWTGGVTNFPVNSQGVNTLAGEWFEAGTGLADQTLTTSVRANLFSYPPTSFGFHAGVYGKLGAITPVLGIIGDSIAQGTGDTESYQYGGRSIERAFRNVVPVINLARQAETGAQYIARRDGRDMLCRDAITHLLYTMGRNDLSAGVNLATMQTRLQQGVQPWLARGVKTWAVTVMPYTNSTDSWASTGNQTQNAGANNAVRLTYNAWLRANWRSLGLAGLLDYAAVVDPTDAGVWRVDPTAGPNTGAAAVGVPVLSGGAIASIGFPTYSSGVANFPGVAGYPASQSALPCVVTRYPDDPAAGGAVVTCATDATGLVTGFTVVSGGSYTVPPMVCPQGAWTLDGLHPTRRAYDALIGGCGIGPQMLT